jgi:hypothetical protein
MGLFIAITATLSPGCTPLAMKALARRLTRPAISM